MFLNDFESSVISSIGGAGRPVFRVGPLLQSASVDRGDPAYQSHLEPRAAPEGLPGACHILDGRARALAGRAAHIAAAAAAAGVQQGEARAALLPACPSHPSDDPRANGEPELADHLARASGLGLDEADHQWLACAAHAKAVPQPGE